MRLGSKKTTGSSDSITRCSPYFSCSSSIQRKTGLEAIACGCVSLVPSLGGTDEYIEHHVNGYAADPRDEASVFGMIHQFVDLNEDERSRLHDNSIATSQKLSVDKAGLSVYGLFN